MVNCLLVDVAVAFAFTALYAYMDEKAFEILYNGRRRFDGKYNTERLLSVLVIGLIPFIGFGSLCYCLYTLSDRVEAHVWNIRRIVKKRSGVIIVQEPCDFSAELALFILRGQIIFRKLKCKIATRIT